MFEFNFNGEVTKVDVPSGTPLLWVVREELKRKGTKFGCGKGLCGACTMHLNCEPTRTCILPVDAVAGQKVTTIEHQKGSGGELHPVQKAWVKHSVPQCGYCQSGQIMQAIGLLNRQQKWTETELVASMSGNLCRCGTYNKIKTALLDAAREMGKLA